MAVEVAPGVFRLGNEIVNFYVVEDGGSMTLVDAALPGFQAQLEAFLRERGRGLADLEAVVLTHGHVDHVGVAEAVRAAGATVHIHAADAEMARTGKAHKRGRSLFPYLRYGPTWSLLALSVRAGGFRTPKLTELSTFTADQELGVPGGPRLLHTPGHSPGHVVLHLPDRGVLFAGDAICTRNPLTGRRGPQVMPGAFALSTAQAIESLARLEPLEADALLPGHGEPWTGGVPAAVARARRRPQLRSRAQST
jgi:glyoxylase-like metal-dependent hydrolase (beta-lactamase superfamily II)